MLATPVVGAHVVTTKRSAFRALVARTITARHRTSGAPISWQTRSAYVMLLGFAASALFAPLLAPFDPIVQLDVALKNAPPSRAHLLGTDSFARDALSRLMYGARASLTISTIATIVGVMIGVVWGTLATLMGEVTRDVWLGVIDILRTIPRMLLMLLAFAVFGALNAPALGLLLGLLSWPSLAVLVEAHARSIRALPYSEAAVALGASRARLIARTIAPQLAAPIGVASALLLADVLTVEAGLSFIGLGIRPPHASWGGMIQDALPYLRSAPLGVALPSACIVAVVLSATWVADGHRRHGRGTGTGP